MTCPEDAGIDATLARTANAASDRSRPACDQLTSTWAALIGPMRDKAGAEQLQQPRSDRTHQPADLAFELAGLAGQELDPQGVERNPLTVMRCSNDRVGRSRSPAQ